MTTDKTSIKRYGTRAEVWHGTARMTKGRLTKKDFIKNRHGRIVSRIKSLKHSRNDDKNPLKKLGFQQKKGSKTFGPINLEEKDKNKKKKTKSSNNKKSSKNNSNSNSNNSNNKSKNSGYLKKIGNAFSKMF